MTSIYQTKVKLRQIPFVVLWFAILMALLYFVPTNWKFTQSLSLVCWWSVLAVGVQRLEPRNSNQSTTSQKIPKYTYPMNMELYKKAIEHNREQQTLFIRLWLAGLLFAIIGVCLKILHYKTSGFMITIGLFLTSFLTKSLFPNNRVTRA